MKKIVKTILFVVIVSTTYVQAQTDDALKITDSGNVGINTSNPTEKLEVNGNVKATGNVTATGNINATTVNATGKVQENGKDLLPKGTIVMWYPITGSTTPPAGWKICDGTDNTPDLRGRFIVGVGKSGDGDTDYKLKDTGGSEKVTLTENQMPSHKHELGWEGQYHDTSSREGKQGWPANNKFTGVYATNRSGGSCSDAVKSTGGNEPHENRPPYYALYYIMKL
jgi:microcystin-dependent protein